MSLPLAWLLIWVFVGGCFTLILQRLPYLQGDAGRQRLFVGALALFSLALLFTVAGPSPAPPSGAFSGATGVSPHNNADGAVAPRAPPADCSAQLAGFSTSESSCPSNDFFTDLYNAGFACKPATIINVGANKGYVLTEMLAIFAPLVGVGPRAQYDAIMASGKAINEFTACGMCDDCKKPPPPSSAASCPAPLAPITLHAFEPTSDAFGFLEGLAGLVAAAGDFAAHVHLHLHRAAVVENQTATPAVHFSNCAGGGEGCAITTGAVGGGVVAVPAFSIDTWARDEGVRAISMLFVDAEGFDPAVLRGARGMLEGGRVAVLAFEVNSLGLWLAGDADDSINAILGWLDRDAGMDCFQMQRETFTPKGRAVKLTGCEAPEEKAWSNVLCVRREERAMLAVLEERTKQVVTPTA